jgi:polysaccharide biosynthesis protein VpsM
MSKTALAVAVSLMVAANVAMAQDGTGVQAGPFRVRPTIGITFAHDSNVAQTATNEISSFYTRISPGIRLDSGNEARSFSLSYELDSGRYKDSDEDDYNDQVLSAGVKLSPSVRTSLAVAGNINRGHDRRGTNSQQGLVRLNDADRWERKGIDADFTYGAPGARGLLGFGAGFADLNYLNNRGYSRFGDRKIGYLDGKFGWRIASKTSAYFSASNSNVDYDLRRGIGASSYSLDSTDRTYLVGLQFDATGKTSGHVGVGRTQKRFDDRSLSNYSGVAWDVGVQFRPRSYSVFDLTATRGTRESVNFDNALSSTDFLIARGVTLAWTHGWSDRFHTAVDIGQENLDYQRARASLRDDTVNFWGLSADYKLREWLSLGAGYKSYSRDGSVSRSTALANDLFDYDRDEFSVSFEASL